MKSRVIANLYGTKTAEIWSQLEQPFQQVEHGFLRVHMLALWKCGCVLWQAMWRIVSNEWRVLRMAIQKLVIHRDQRRQLSLEKSIVEDSRHCSVMKTDEEELLQRPVCLMFVSQNIRVKLPKSFLLKDNIEAQISLSEAKCVIGEMLKKKNYKVRLRSEI